MKGRVCQRSTNRYFIRIYAPGHGEIRVARDEMGRVLDSKERADALLGKIRYELEQKTFDATKYSPERKDYWFENLIKKYISKQEDGYARYLKSVNKNHYVKLKGRDVRELRTIDVSDFYDTVKSMKSAVNIMKKLKMFLKWAWSQYQIASPFPEFPKLNEPEPETVWADADTQGEVLKHIPENHLPFVLFCMWHGVRPVEARKLLWSDVNLKEETVLIRHGKTGKKTILPLHPAMLDILKGTTRSIVGSVFTTVSGEPYPRNHVQRPFQEACKKVGVKINFYQFCRHSLATQAIQRGESIYLIQKVLGHSSTRHTQRYAKVDVTNMRRIIGPVVEMSDYRKFIATDKNSGSK